MNYQHYTIEDFVFDDAFRQWVLLQQEADFWEEFLRQHPDKKEDIRQARKMVLALEKDKDTLSKKESEAILQNIHQRIDTVEHPSVPVQTRSWVGIAASVSVILLLSVLAFWWQAREEVTTYTTAYGEVEEIILPDSSKVTLNANSELSWHHNSEERLVQLSGEAFFEIKKKSDGRKFIVKSGEVLVEVLGTSFNVKQRRANTQVVLTEGKVALHHQPTGVKALMQPGDMVSLSNQEKAFIHQQVRPERYISWTERKLVINNTPLGEIAATIEDTYGYQVLISDKDLADRKITATTTVPLKDLDTLLRLIEITFEAEVSRQEQQIKIVPKKNRQ